MTMENEFKPFRNMPEASQEQVDMYHTGLIVDAIEKIDIFSSVPLPDSIALKIDTSRAVDHIKKINTLLVNAASVSWAKGMIELIGDIQENLNDIRSNSYSSIITNEQFVYWIERFLSEKKRELYAIVSTMNENCNTISAEIENPKTQYNDGAQN